MKRILLIAGILIVFLSGQNIEQQIDGESGLIIDGDWELVRDSCIPCHSSALIVHMKASRQIWLDTIRWMQKDMGLWEFAPEEEKQILDYLSKNYGLKYATRKRLPLNILESTQKK